MLSLSPDRKAEITRQAKELLYRYLKSAQAVSAGSVDPYDLFPLRPDVIIADVLKLRLERVEEIPNEDGNKTVGLYRSEGMIALAECQDRKVWRFTAAHEIGHYILHPKLDGLRERPLDHGSPAVSLTPIEQEANFFAAQLLMPPKLVRGSFHERFGGAFSVASMSDDDAHLLSAGKLRLSQLKAMQPKDRAALFACATWFNRQFPSLTEAFGVSATAMALQLLELRMVS